MSERIADIKESGLLARLGPLLRRHTDGLPLGTGDDVAITPGSSERLVWTIDTMVEGTHFRWYDDPECTAEAIGWKLAAVNISDLASKGARGLYALVSLAVPSDARIDRIEGVYRGLDEALSLHGMRLIGGDTVGAPQWCLTLAVVGALEPGRPIAARSAARPGMAIYTTGAPGESGCGFDLLSGAPVDDPALRRHLIRRHLRPTPRMDFGRALVASLPGLAMIDLSDGIAKDAGEIARASGVRLRIETLPIADTLLRAGVSLRRDPAEWVLRGGEDYELLFCCDPAHEPAVRAMAGELPIHRIGTVVAGSGVSLKMHDGREVELAAVGFDHFGA